MVKILSKVRLEVLIMMGDRKKQAAGNNSQQIQANTINITNVNGIDEKRAREIVREMYAVARRDFSHDAYECANQRIAMFEESLMSKITKIDGALEKFSDPSFQLLLTEAHKTAASTEREADYDLLSELLIHRIKKGELRKTRVGLKRAVEIVDQIDDDALCAITIVHVVGKLLPIIGTINGGLDALQDIFEKLEYLNLPEGTEWIEHLDILNAVRINTFGRLKKLNQVYTERLDGYLCVGIRKKSENYDKAIALLDSIKFPASILINHELLNDYVRLPIVTLDTIETLSLTLEYESEEGAISRKEIIASDEQKQCLRKIVKLYDNSEEMKQQVVNSFMCQLRNRKSLRILQEWWDSIPVSFEMTAVGTALAHANAQRCYPNIPPMD